MQTIIENVIIMEEVDFEIACVSENPHDILDAAKTTEDVGIYFLDIDLGTDSQFFSQ